MGGRGGWSGALQSLARPVEHLAQALVDFLIEDVCVICGGRSCPPAVARLPAAEVGDPMASRFAGRLMVPVEHRCAPGWVVRNHPICPGCVRSLEPVRSYGRLGLGEDKTTSEIRVIAPYMIESNILILIHLLKFSRYHALAGPIGMAMAEAYHAMGRRDGAHAVVVAVPRSRGERRRRGPDATRWLATAFSRALGATVNPDALVKTRTTKRQSQTPSERRAGNVRGAFACRPGSVAGRHVILLDDLVTTGATAAACVAELIAAGASDVEVACFARAL